MLRGCKMCVFLHKISLAQNPWPCISPALYQCMTECVLIKLLKDLTLSSLSCSVSVSLMLGCEVGCYINIDSCQARVGDIEGG